MAKFAHLGSYFQRQNIIELIDVWMDGYQIFDASFVSRQAWQKALNQHLYLY